jgi:hypothetical protein
MAGLTCIVLAGFSACKKSVQYTLTVTISAGVLGAPTAGSHSCQDKETVVYEYFLQNGYSNLRVTLNGTVVGSSGTLIMNQNYTLEVIASEGYDISGLWDITLDSARVKFPQARGSIPMNWEIEFSGTQNSGDVIIANTTVGSYSVSAADVSFYHQTTDSLLGILRYVYQGTLTANDAMNGQVTVYQKISKPGLTHGMYEIVVHSGTWRGSRKTN